jgi:iron(III) transport system permease protein
LSLALVTALVITAAAMAIAYGARLAPSPLVLGSARIAGMGYAIPGSVIAVGILVPFTQLDNVVDGWMRAAFGFGTGLLITGTIAALVFAYLVRFLAVALGTVESGFGKISPSMDAVARTLGRGSGRTLLEVHLPMLRGSLLTAAILVFVEVMKELPATLIVRPFNFETLAVRVYRFAADERLAEASTAALAIVAVGILPVILLSRAISKSRVGAAAPAPRLDPPMGGSSLGSSR